MRKDRMKTKEYSAGSTVLTVAFVLICLVWIMPIYRGCRQLPQVQQCHQSGRVCPAQFGESFVGFANYVKGMTFGNYPFLKSVGYSLFITRGFHGADPAVLLHGGMVHCPGAERLLPSSSTICACSP